MKHKLTRAIVSSLVTASMLMTSTALAMPVSAYDTVNSDFDMAPIILPWYPVSSMPAQQDFEVVDGALKVRIINNQGPEGRWDLQLRHRGLSLIQGHNYTIKGTITADADGYIYSMIGDYSGNHEYWHNLSGQEWQPYFIKAGETLEFEDTFTLKEDPIGPSQWTFQYADNQDMFYGDDKGMPNGSTLTFDNLELKDNTGSTCGEPAKSIFEICGMIIPESNVRVNQLGYSKHLVKRASYCTDNPDPCEFELRNSDGNTVYTNTASAVVVDPDSGTGETYTDNYGTKKKDSGKYVQILDFTEFDEEGKYTIFVKDNVGVSGTFFHNYKGFYDTELKDDKLMSIDYAFDDPTHCMNESHEITISENVYSDKLLADSLNYFYQNRSDGRIEEKYITSGEKSHLAHKAGYSEDIAYVQHNWQKYYIGEMSAFDGDKDYSFNVAGGWYDADSHCKSVVNGAYSVWNLQNAYELSKTLDLDGKFADNNLSEFPTGDNNVPDILDEARYELEWMQKMIVSGNDPFWGESSEGMLYHKVQDVKWRLLPISPLDYIYDYNMPRIIKPPTYAATLDYAACAAQAARLWKEYDPEFADKCLETAKKAYQAVKDKDADLAPDQANIISDDPYFAPVDQAIGSVAYGDSCALDELYWAGCELFLSTEDDGYYKDLKAFEDTKSSQHIAAFKIPTEIITDSEPFNSVVISSFDSFNTAALGNMSLVINPEALSEADHESLVNSFENAAEIFTYLMEDDGNSMSIPFKPEITGGIDNEIREYPSYSNEYITNNARILAYAALLKNDNKYLSAASEAMDYIFGRNGLGISYVTGYGTKTVKNPQHRFWCRRIDPDFPEAPDGVLVSGATTSSSDIYMKAVGMYKDLFAPQKYYVDTQEAWSVNNADLQLNASLAALVSILQDSYSEKYEEKTTTTTTTATTSSSTTTTTTSVGSTTTTTDTTSDSTTTTTVSTSSDAEEVIYGDANEDKSVDLSDAVLIMQSLANPSKFKLTDHGKKNADCSGNGDGITNSDALSIQKYLLKIIDKLPESRTEAAK